MRRFRLLLGTCVAGVVVASGCDREPPGGEGPQQHAVFGTVRGARQEGVEITLGFNGVNGARVTHTDANGTYSFTGLENGTYTVSPRETGFSFSPAHRTFTIVDADAAQQDFTAFVPRSISGTVSGTALSPTGVGVELTSADGHVHRTNTDWSGAYRFDGFPDGNYTVAPQSCKFTFSPSNRAVIVAGADATGNDFTAEVAHRISGTVSGATTSGVTMTLIVFLGWEETMTDGAGAYEFLGCEGIPYTLVPRKLGFTFSPEHRGFTMGDGHASGMNFTAYADAAY